MKRNPPLKRSRIGLLAAITLACLFVILPLPGLNARAQTATDPDVIAAVRDFAQTKDARQWMSVNRSRLTPEFLASLDRLSDQAAAQGNQTGDASPLHFAQIAKLLEANALLQRGDRANALRAFIGATDVEFMLADSSEAYEHVRQSANDSAERAADVGAPELAFRARVIAADSCYQASILKGLDVKARDEWEHDGLADLGKAANLASSNQNRAWLERFVSLSGAMLNDAHCHYGYGGNEDEKVAALKQLTASLQTTVPAEFSFQVRQEKDWTNDAEIARLLAALSYDYGDPAIGANRLRYAARLARSHGDTDRLASSISQLYEAEKARLSDPAQLRALRAEVRDDASPLRAGFVSRGGRLWAAARADSLLGQLTRDELSAGAKVDDAFGEIEGLKARLLLDQLTVRWQSLRSATAVNAAADVERKLLAFPSCVHRHDDLVHRFQSSDHIKRRCRVYRTKYGRQGVG